MEPTTMFIVAVIYALSLLIPKGVLNEKKPCELQEISPVVQEQRSQNSQSEHTQL